MVGVVSMLVMASLLVLIPRERAIPLTGRI
jgi:hypothetical protein